LAKSLGLDKMQRIAIYQAGAVRGDKTANIERVRRAARAAGALGANVLVLPELFLTGYNIGQLVHELAEPRDGPSLKTLGEIARQSECGLVIGFPERDGSQVFNSAALIDARGVQVCVYRKMHLFGETERELFSAGHEPCVVEFCDVKIGLAVCYDIELPEFCRVLKSRGADFILTPTANMTPYWEVPTTFVRARALENAVTVAYVNHCGWEDNMRFTGLSCITGPDGVDLARAGRNVEALLIADVPAARSLRPLSTQLTDLRLGKPSPK
jgi:5-aminopentanamidase